ncbi:hypothetical protein GCM10029964_020290 [Kibdelosporangium lantanae]
MELYSTGADDHPTEVHHHWLDLEEPDVDNLKAGYHALLTRLDPTKYPKPKPTAEQPDPVVVHDSTSQGTTRHEALLRSAEVVAYFGDVTLHGQVPMKGLSVLWHEQERLWLVEVPGHFGGPTSAELLQEFARGGRASMNNNGYHSGQLYRDDYVSAQLESGVTEATGAYVTIYAYLDTTRDFLGVSDHGEGLYSNRYGAGLLEFRLDRPDRDRLKSAFRTLHRRLATAGPDTFADHQPTVMATFTRPDSDRTRLDLTREPDGQWLVTLHPKLTRPATTEAVRALAEAARQVLAGEGRRTVPLLRERFYRMDITIGPDNDAFHLTATVTTTKDDGTVNVLDHDGHFAPVTENQLRRLPDGLSP